MATTITINPANGQQLKEYQNYSIQQVNDIIEAQQQAFQTWKTTSIEQRKKLFSQLEKQLHTDQEKFAQLICQEMGKPVEVGKKEIEKCAWLCRYYIENVDRFLQDELIETEMQKSYITIQPIGIVFAVMPWNFPFWQVLRFAVPNIMAGNVGLLKHASITTGCSLAIEKLFSDAGFPEHVFRSIVLAGRDTAAVIEHPLIKAITLTGSDKAGRSVAGNAGQQLKKVVLELGGSDPYLILEDADLEHAAKQCVASRMNNSGQVCISAKRIIVCEKVFKQFEQLIQKKLADYPIKTVLGPIARGDLRDEIHQQVTKSIAEGAELLLGGSIPSGEGYYYPATLLSNVKPGNTAFDDEIFGPVVALVQAKDEQEAISLANQSQFGLAAAVFTQDLAKGEKLARNLIHAGTCNVNSLVSSDPRLPFGGIEQSGFGREMSKAGMREFVNVKTVNIA